jgi:hypothetical protein
VARKFFLKDSPAYAMARELISWPVTTTVKRVRWQDYIHAQNRSGRISNAETEGLLKLLHRRKKKRYGKRKKIYGKRKRRH